MVPAHTHAVKFDLTGRTVVETCVESDQAPHHGSNIELIGSDGA